MKHIDQAIKQARFLTLTLLAAGAAMPVLAQLNKPTIIEFNAPGAGTGAYQGTQVAQINPLGVIIGCYFTADGAVGAYGYLRTPDGKFESFAPSGAYYTYPQSINLHGEVADTPMTTLLPAAFCVLRAAI